MARARLVFMLLTALVGPSWAQSRFDPAEGDSGRKAVATFEDVLAGRGQGKLKCTVNRYAPSLNYDLQVWTGFSMSFPGMQFQPGRKAFMVNVFRVTPLKPAGEPVWFFRRYDLPPIPPEAAKNKKIQLEAGGGFLVGSGEYQVDWVLIDDLDRACTARWQLKSDPPEKERIGIRPGFADDDSRLMRWPGPKPAADGAGMRATILVNAGPTFRRRFVSKLSSWDRRLLTTAVTSTIDRVGFSSVRVVVFDLERRRVLFEDDNFGARGYRRLLGSLGEADFATIDYSVLADGGSEYDFLESLLSAETRRDQAPGAMVFVTPSWRDGPRRRKVAEQLAEASPEVFCLALAPRNPWVSGSVVDFVKQLKGRVLAVFRPTDLAKATAEIRESLERSGPAGSRLGVSQKN